MCMILTYSKLGTLMYYSSLLSVWQCCIFLRDYDNHEYLIQDLFKKSDEHTKFKCQDIYVRSFYSDQMLLFYFKTFVKFINTFKLLHRLHVFQINNVKFK